MPDLTFHVESVAPVEYAATPQLGVKLKICAAGDHYIQSILLQAQVQIETTRRRYDPGEQARLLDLFGTPERWGQTLRTMLWMHTSVNVRPFTGETTAVLPLPCTFDFSVAATKYFDGLAHGDIPICLLFSGTIFYDDGESGLRVAQIPWDREARFKLPVDTWKQLIDCYYPNCAWLNLRRDIFDRLHEFKRQRGIATFEQAMEQLLP